MARRAAAAALPGMLCRLCAAVAVAGVFCCARPALAAAGPVDDAVQSNASSTAPEPAAAPAPAGKSLVGSQLPASDGEEIWDENGQLITKHEEGLSPADVAAATPDPLEGWNRMWFTFNDKLYFWALKPAAEGYADVVPERPRLWVRNFFHNLLFPVRFVSLLLQAKFAAAAVETSRFIGNTAFGLGGFADVTGDCKPFRPIPSTEQDMGLTLGDWGMGNGFYLVWPFIGPSTARDTLGYAGDYFLTPQSYVNPWYWSIATKAYDSVNAVSLRLGDYESLKAAAIDPYESLRDGYLRLRAQRMGN